jgi:hypothetical protein
MWVNGRDRNDVWRVDLPCGAGEEVTLRMRYSGSIVRGNGGKGVSIYFSGELAEADARGLVGEGQRSDVRAGPE